MNSVKNLMIIAVLGAVGYGVYVSLSRNNVDPAQPLGVADGWPGESKTDPSGATTTKLGGPLALGGSSPRPDAAGNLSAGAIAPQLAPPLMQTSPGSSSAAPGLTPLAPFGSSAPAGGSSPMAPPLGPGATLGTPVPADALPPPPSANPSIPPGGAVRNLEPPPAAVGPINPPPPAARPADELVQSKFAAFMDEVQKKLNEGKLAEAHLALSMLYGNPDLPADQTKQITALLDQLAGAVIYSRRHCLEPAYFTKPGETIEKIAQQYKVPWQLLAWINGLMPPAATNTEQSTKDQPLPAGMELKVVRGPFDAVIQLDKKELTLRAPNGQGQYLYAGRFPIGVGRDQPKLDGQYTVQNKAINPTYHGPDGVTIQPGDPRNPLRDAWIGLSDQIGIHGAADPQAVGRDDNRGTICVGHRDLQDLYGILSVGSRVTVLR
jgi:lipoprotein-anchoring transpeptidase ErfK/SrfK